jgi:hypothetical protein
LASKIDPSEVGGGDINTIIEYIGDNIGDIVTYLSGELPHTDLDFSGFGAIGTGVSEGSTDHDDSYHHAYNDGSGETGHDTFVDDHDYRTTGDYWMAEIHLSADGTTDSQYWTAAKILADVTGAIELTCNANSFWISNTAAKDLNIGTITKLWGNINLLADTNVNIGTLTGDLDVSAKSDIRLTYDSGGLYINAKLVTSKYSSEVGPNEKVLVIEV